MVDIINKNAAYYKAIFFVVEEDIGLVKQAGQEIYNEEERIFQAFYDWMRSHPFFSEYYTEEVLNAIQESQAVFWEDALLGDISDDYVDRQRFFGLIFADVGIPFDAYSGFMVCFYKLIRELFLERFPDNMALLNSFNKITGLVLSVVTDGYNQAISKVLKEQNMALMEMSTPITKLWEGILLLPLVGFIDSKRAANLMSAILNTIYEEHGKAFILDISGIAAVDTAVANYLIKITKATKLMGCTCFITGISPAVAQTMIELGIQIIDTNTSGNMLDALKKALVLTNTQVF